MFNEINTGWINSSLLEKKNCVPLNNKLDLKSLGNIFYNFDIKHGNSEMCPVFPYPSENPKIIFSENKKFGETSILTVNRNFLSLCGFPAYGVHCNIWDRDKDKFIIYFAKRSKSLDNFPSFFDNPIAGGQPENLSITDNLRKEAFEEAGLKKKFLKNVKKGSTVSYKHNHKGNFISSVIFNYHLKKNKSLVLRNIDGEVESFFSISLYETYKLLEKKKLKPNCIIPILDFILLNEYDFLSKGTIVEIRKFFKNDKKY